MEVINEKKILKEELPNSTAVLVLGILSVVLCWCYGVFGFILGIIALVLFSSSKKRYLAEPDRYDISSYKNLNIGRVCSIIGICIASVWFIFFVLLIIGIVGGVGLSALSHMCM